jgi:hypothetical protein
MFLVPFFCSINSTAPARFSTMKSISPKCVQCTPWKTRVQHGADQARTRFRGTSGPGIPGEFPGKAALLFGPKPLSFQEISRQLLS